jgi:hypothetical protein
MTRSTSARLAGSLFLLYIAAGITDMVLFSRASGGEGTAARLASIAGLVDGGSLVWMPMLVFELTLAFWLIVRGVAQR